MRGSILLPRHEARGARLADQPQGPVALTFGNVPAEYRAGVEGAALLDDTDRGRVAARGGDARDFLHRLLANDVRGLAPGQGNANLLLSAKGKVLFGFDLARRDDGAALTVGPGQAPELLAALDRYLFSEDVALADETESAAPLGLCGPRAREVLAAVAGELPELAPGAWAEVAWRGGPLAVAAVEVAGSAGLSADAGPARAGELWDALVEAGASPVGLAARDILRVEAVRPAFGRDVTEDVYPQEAGLEGSLSLAKGCYVGQEVVAKIDTYGGLNKRLLPLRVSHDDPVPAGTPLVEDEGGEPRQLGVVTSWAYSFAQDGGVVLAYVKRKHQDVGRTFRLGDGPATATVLAAPLRPR